jgi:hypothetical protein
MKQILLIILFSSLFITGCKFSKQNKNSLIETNGKSLKLLVGKAAVGDTLSNNKLNGLVDLNYPVNTNYLLFNVDSVITNNGKKYYTVLLNFSNPIYNRFAVYDPLLKCYLIDKSLNGYLYESTLNIDNIHYIKISEDFNSKDILTLNRLSLYRIGDDSVSLIFRDFTKLVENGVVYNQNITKITPGFIRTELNSTSASIIKNRQDVFYYNIGDKKYISPSAVFYDFIKAKILNFKYNLEKPEITDKRSMFASVSINHALDTISTTSNTKDIQGFSLTLTDNWKTFRNRHISEFLRRDRLGTIFSNKILNADIYVIVIPNEDSAEMFINRKLTRSVSGKYKIRFSDKFSSTKYFVQFFEFSCGLKKYLLILKTSKSTYTKDRSIYQAIINSFKIDC